MIIRYGIVDCIYLALQVCVHVTTHAHTTLPKLVVSDPSILINNPIILSVMCIWKIIVIFNLPLVLSCAPYPTNFWILAFFSVLVMFHTIASTFLSYFFHQEAVPVMVKDIDSRVLILDLTLPSCVNSGKSLILFASISSSVQWRVDAGHWQKALVLLSVDLLHVDLCVGLLEFLDRWQLVSSRASDAGKYKSGAIRTFNNLVPEVR